MSFLKKFDFNKPSGWISVIFVSVAISLLIFGGVYMNEGFGWLAAHKEEPMAVSETIGKNWVRGSYIALGSAAALLFLSFIMLAANKKSQIVNKPLLGRLDMNGTKGLLALVFLSVSFVFFLNAGLYRIEVAKWFYAAIEFGQEWYFREAASWVTASTTMALVGIGLSAVGLTCLVLAWNKR